MLSAATARRAVHDDGICLSRSPGRRKNPLKGRERGLYHGFPKNKGGGVAPNALLEYLYMLISETAWMQDNRAGRHAKCASWAEEV